MPIRHQVRWVRCLWLVSLHLSYAPWAVLASRSERASSVDCGYKQCPQTRDNALNVHVIAHSHMDTGWIKTFDQYYYGTNSQVSTVNVQLIYHTVLSELLHDSNRKFTFSEVAYFWRWWKEQRPATRRTFRSLVQQGRVEFAGGGWVQHDAATTHYASVIDQMTWGLRKLNDTLGPCGKPRAAWQVDNYGHSREQSALLPQMGYDGLFLGRVDYTERERMMDEGAMEMMWRGSDVLGKMSDIMTHTLYNLYHAPAGFCFDFVCSDEPIMDHPDSPSYNAHRRVEEFLAQLEQQASVYSYNNVLVTMGGDFTYQSATNWYMSIDKLISLVNVRSKNVSNVHMFYSSPSCYLKAVYLHGRREKALNAYRHDFLPYGSDRDTYWSGFFTSRPSLKYFERYAYNFMQVTKQLTVLSKSADTYELHQMRNAMGLMQHHDAITGTSQQHVTSDYSRILFRALDACSRKISKYLGVFTSSWFGDGRLKKSQQLFSVCHRLNLSECWLSESHKEFLVLVYNPLGARATHYVRLPVIASHFSIASVENAALDYQVLPLTAAEVSAPGRHSRAIQELWFEADVPPLGYTSYHVTSIAQGASSTDNPSIEFELDSETPIIANQYYRVSVDRGTGRLSSVQSARGLRAELAQTFLYYSQGRSPSGPLASGAYTFRPKGTAVPVSERVAYQIVRGALVKEIRQRFADWLTQVIRLYRDGDFVELEWIVGPVPLGSDVGKEVISRFSSNLSTGGLFYTDSNGRQMMARSCWNDSSSPRRTKKPLPACYVPVTSRISLRDAAGGAELSVLTDRAQGGASYEDGELELMVHRRLLTDDDFGLEESLNEEAYGVGLVARGKHRLTLDKHRPAEGRLSADEKAADLSRRTHNPPQVFLAAADAVPRRKWQRMRNRQFSALRPDGLPPHVHILTLEPWRGGSVLLRLENTLQSERDEAKTEHSHFEEPETILSSVITVDLRKIFVHLKLTSVRETTLAANQWLHEARQMDWSTRFHYDGGDDDDALAQSSDHSNHELNTGRQQGPDDDPYEAPSKQMWKESLISNIAKDSRILQDIQKLKNEDDFDRRKRGSKDFNKTTENTRKHFGRHYGNNKRSIKRDVFQNEENILITKENKHLANKNTKPGAQDIIGESYNFEQDVGALRTKRSFNNTCHSEDCEKVKITFKGDTVISNIEINDTNLERRLDFNNMESNDTKNTVIENKNISDNRVTVIDEKSTKYAMPNETGEKIKNIDIVQTIRYILNNNPVLVTKFKKRIGEKKFNNKLQKLKIDYLNETKNSSKNFTADVKNANDENSTTYYEEEDEKIAEMPDTKYSSEISGRREGGDNVQLSNRRAFRRPRTENRPVEEIDIDDGVFDDGVTKSMFDMYYKPKMTFQNKRPRRRKGMKPRPRFREYSRNLRRFIQPKSIPSNQKDEVIVISKIVETTENIKETIISEDQDNYEFTHDTVSEKELIEDIADKKSKYSHEEKYIYVDNLAGDEDSGETIKKLEHPDAIDINKDIIPKSNLAKMRAKRRREDFLDYAEISTYDSTNPEGGEERNKYREELETGGTIEVTNPRARRTHRVKRATPQTRGRKRIPEKQHPSADDYIITLRPTQIRTFIVRFE